MWWPCSQPLTYVLKTQSELLCLSREDMHHLAASLGAEPRRELAENVVEVHLKHLISRNVALKFMTSGIKEMCQKAREKEALQKAQRLAAAWGAPTQRGGKAANDDPAPMRRPSLQRAKTRSFEVPSSGGGSADDAHAPKRPSLQRAATRPLHVQLPPTTESEGTGADDAPAPAAPPRRPTLQRAKTRTLQLPSPTSTRAERTPSPPDDGESPSPKKTTALAEAPQAGKEPSTSGEEPSSSDGDQSDYDSLLLLCAVRVQYAYWSHLLHRWMGGEVTIEQLVPGLFGRPTPHKTTLFRHRSSKSKKNPQVEDPLGEEASFKIAAWRQRIQSDGQSSSSFNSHLRTSPRDPQAGDGVSASSTTPTIPSVLASAAMQPKPSDLAIPPSPMVPMSAASASSRSDRAADDEARLMGELGEMLTRGFNRMEETLKAKLDHVGMLSTKMDALDASVGALAGQLGAVEQRLSTLEAVPEVKATLQRG